MGLWDTREGSREGSRRDTRAEGGWRPPESTQVPGAESPGDALPLPAWVTLGPFVTSLADIPLQCTWSARLRPPARSVRQDGDGTGQEPGAGEEPPSAGHVFPRGTEAFCRSFPLFHHYHFRPSRRMAERPPSCPGVAWEEDRAPQKSSSLPEPGEVCMVQPLQIGE